MSIIEMDACWDEPRGTDFSYEELFGLMNDALKAFPLGSIHIQNQGTDPLMLMSCTRQGLAHITNGNNILAQGEQEDGLAKRVWLEYCKTVPFAKTDGASLQSSLDQFLAQKLISGYSKTYTIEAMKSAIDSGRFIFTGSQNGDWAYVSQTRKYRLRTDNRTRGHAICIVGYNTAGWIALNSYGPENGVFEIPYNLTQTLFSRYAISDFEDAEKILSFKRDVMQKNIQKAIDAGITNGSRQDKPATRGEVMTMMGALISLIEVKIGKL